MNKQVLNYVIEKTHELMDAPSCCAEAKAASQAWLDALGTEKEAEMTERFFAELEADLIPIDGLIAFAGSDHGISVFGEEGAKNLLAHAKEIKEAGALYCDCPACSAVAAILEKKDDLLS